MAQPLLTFAIPVYNFGSFVGETIASILNGAEKLSPAEFEVVIFDGGSTDNTEVVVSQLLERHTNLRYMRAGKRGGIDHDLNLAINLAEGRFVWLFSGDDLLQQGWDRHVKPLLINCDVILVPTVLCNLDMSERRKNPILTDGKQCAASLHLKLQDHTFEDYLERAMSLDALFGFMSSVIVRAAYWHNLPERQDYYGSCWAHCARLIQGFQQGCNLVYLPEYLIRKRGENDSFLEHGFIHRIGISVKGWDRIIMEFFPQSSIKAKIYGLLRHDISLSLFLYGKASARTKSEEIDIRDMARLLYKERCPTVFSKINYGIFRLSPLIAGTSVFISFAVPALARLRHQIRRVFS